MRATTWVERAGVPAVGVICTGFVPSAHAIGRMLGHLSLRIVEYPRPNIGTQTKEEIKSRAETVLDHVIHALTQPAPKPQMSLPGEPDTGPREIVFKGNLKEVNDFFYDHQWTDGLPIVPPTVEAVEEMLKYTDRSFEEVLAILQPGRREATPWAVAINGVMAGCRPACMPLLIALIEAIAEPRFGLQHAGSTAGWTPLIVLNGPIIRELNFNSGQGVLRPQSQANVTVSRFLRLAMMNLAGYQIGTTDLACFGMNYLPVLAEAEEVSPYEPLSVERGFAKGSNVITVLSCLSMSYHFTSQETAEEHLKILANEVKRELGGQYVQVMTIFGPEVSPVLCLSPLVASVLADAGYSKKDIREYIFDHARIPASEFDQELSGLWGGFTACKAVEQGKLPRLFCETDDPQRMLPLLHHPEELLIVVSGSAARNRSFVAKQTGDQGLAVSKEIKLPSNWATLPK